MVHKEEWEEWQKSPAHRFYLKYLTKLRENVKEEWAQGNYTREDVAATAQMNAKFIGVVETLERLINEVTYEGMVEELVDG